MKITLRYHVEIQGRRVHGAPGSVYSFVGLAALVQRPLNGLNAPLVRSSGLQTYQTVKSL